MRARSASGNQVFVAGTTARGHHLDGDAYTQMMAAIATDRSGAW